MNDIEKVGKKRYKFMLIKRWFDIGYGVTSPAKLFIYSFAIVTGNIKDTFYIGIGYMLFCFVFGWAYMKYGLYEAGQEVGNQYNLFQKQLREDRKKYKGK